MAEREFDRLYARLDDLCDVAARGELAISDFLSPRELHFGSRYLLRRGAAHLCFGGYAGAERCRIYLLPDYLEDVPAAEQLCDFGLDPCICALRICTDGYRRLEHRDYLGSVLGLGVDRAVLGDVFVHGEDGVHAVILCTSEIAPFFEAHIERISSEKARVERLSLARIEIPERRMAEINGTVASARLDCVLGEICSLSRDKAKAVISAGLVEVDFEAEERPDRVISAPCLLSVRGYGRYRVLSLSELTRKGRVRLRAEKFL